MATFGTWIKKTVKQVWDPDSEQRIQEVADAIIREIQQKRNGFSLATVKQRLDATKRDWDQGRRKAYRTYLERAWRDGKVTVEERKFLTWAAGRLEIPNDEAEAELLQLAQDRFGALLAAAMDDGVIDEDETTRLAEIAESVNFTLETFVNRYFNTEGESFLRGAFAACTQDGILADEAWTRLLRTTDRLGISHSALTNVILPQATRFIEHALADAKSDGELCQEEERQLRYLIDTLGITGAVRSYFLNTIQTLRHIREIGEGKMPLLDRPQGVSIRAGEHVHYHGKATWLQLRHFKNDSRWERHDGRLTITDNRLIFSSETKSFNVRFAEIVAHSGNTGTIRLQRSGKPESVVQVDEFEPVAYTVLDGAIALSNQTRVAKQDEAKTRHIPREVRQRVWQKYGGQCAECGDNQYLEFDHVIPFAKGGSNSDANVQLLCRKCNLKKSDFI